MRNFKRSHEGRFPFLILMVAATFLLPSLPVGAAEGLCDLPAAERPEPIPEPIEICAVTVVSSTEAGSVGVVLHNDATFSIPLLFGSTKKFGPNWDIDIQGEGGFVGFVLISERFTETEGTRVIAGRLAPEYNSWNVLWVHSDGVRQSGLTYTLPADNYRLYLLVDSTPVTLRFRLTGLSGDISISPGRTTAYDVRTLTPQVSLGPVWQVSSGGDTGVIQSLGIGFRAFYMKSSQTGSHTVGACLYPGDPIVPKAGFLPGCPSGSSFDIFGPGASSSIPPDASWGSFGYVGFTYGLEPGRWSQGWWHSSAALVERANMLAFWLDLS